MDKYKESDKELMELLLKLQERSSPIKMSIGRIIDGIVRTGIILHEAAPYVIDTLLKKGYECDLTSEGMIVYKLEFESEERRNI